VKEDYVMNESDSYVVFRKVFLGHCMGVERGDLKMWEMLQEIRKLEGFYFGSVDDEVVEQDGIHKERHFHH
jgi:hypothetical protein